MSGLSAHMEKSYINCMLRAIPYSTPALADLHVALFTADPKDDGSLANEVAMGTWYVRQPIAAWAEPAPLPAPAITGHETYNLTRIDFPVVVGPEVTVTHIAIMDAAVGGNVLLSSIMKTRKILEEDDVLSFAIGTTRFSLD